MHARTCTLHARNVETDRLTLNLPATPVCACAAHPPRTHGATTCGVSDQAARYGVRRGPTVSRISDPSGPWIFLKLGTAGEGSVARRRVQGGEGCLGGDVKDVVLQRVGGGDV